ncbi:sigma-70 family RNA polymerase sigma factor [Methylobacterium sp. V23]|uniref:sigma-70 family RNA polymerase sigma factor n=1 Tax=Methylobacterium sp. V23 TaxID=2044878 RepID=UPI000CDA7BDA|nr:sigma-70 family RNA polymerase sigma factor [Methylobacterium sp. V23]POR41428.1 RNA polymerase subunit sigma-70 [Methylobacterium sp. V23]
MSTEDHQKPKRRDGLVDVPHGELSATGVSPSLPEFVRDHLGRQLQAVYGSLKAEEQPQRLLNLIAQLDVALAHQGSQAASVFRQELLAALPGLRGFALSLVVNATRADDLVQETLLRAWKSQDRFVPGTNLMAWLCTILRNQFYTECRKAKREVEDADGAEAAKIITLPSQEHGIELQKVWAILAKLPPAQREALLLVAGQGMTYEAAAALLGTQTGTMKSRVSRARAFLAETLKATNDCTPA